MSTQFFSKQNVTVDIIFVIHLKLAGIAYED